MKRSPSLLFLLMVLLTPQAWAHKFWLLPSQTVLAGPHSGITVDAAVSNDLFYFNHVPLRLNTLSIIAPNGQRIESQNPATGRYRSVFDVELPQSGTYRLAIVNDGVFASWKEGEERKRWRGQYADLAEHVPAQANELNIRQTHSRIETFVTVGTPSTLPQDPKPEGLQLVALSHPNDLVVGEKTRFRVLLDGARAATLEVEIIPGGTRYRDTQQEMRFTTDTHGEFEVSWPMAGMYWLHIQTRDGKTEWPEVTSRQLSYAATLEVLPQ